MKRFTRLIGTFVVFVLSFLVFARNAEAYLDPLTGSYFLQLVIAALLGGLFAVKLYWNKIKIFFKKLFFKSEKDERA